VVGGLLFSQTLTLYVTPVFYISMDRLQQRFGRGKGKKPEVQSPAAVEEKVPAAAAMRLRDV
jgi:HAE1 family hydrophobic/amphiphilic exporter-1